MNKTVLSLALFLLSYAISAQQVVRLTETSYNRNAAVAHFSFTSDTSYLSVITDSAIGSTFPLMGNSYIDHRNIQGQLLWQYLFKGKVNIASISQDVSGNILFTGSYADTLRIGDSIYANGDPYDYGSLVGQLNASGQLDWVIVEDTFGDNINTSVTRVPNGYILCGINEMSGGFIRFYNSSHELQWAKVLSYGVRTTSDILYNPADQAVYLTGDCEPFAQFDTINVGNPPSAGYLSYLAKFDLDGNIYWVKTAPFVTFDLENKIALNGNDVFLFEGVDTTAINLNISYRLSTVNSSGTTTHSRLLPHVLFNIPAVSFDHNTVGITYRGAMEIPALVYDSVLAIRYQSEFPYTTMGFELTTSAHRKDMMLFAGTFYTDSFSLGNKTVYGSHDPEIEPSYLALIQHGAVHTGINDNISADKMDVLVYPNPANDKVYFSCPSGKQYTVTLTDLAGKIVASSADLSMDITSVISGLYILNIYDVENHLHSYQKLMIRK